jgi:hypothetical protein
MCKYWTVVFLVLMSSLASGQVQPATKGGVKNGVYALFSGGRPNYGDDWLLGGTLGGYLQRSHFLGFDGRVTALRWGPSPFHQYVAVAGPRIALGIERWTVYGTVEGGLGHASAPAGSSYSGSWLLTAGVDYQINPRVKLRLGEFGYGGIEVLQHGLNPKTLSAGVVVKLF